MSLFVFLCLALSCKSILDILDNWMRVLVRVPELRDLFLRTMVLTTQNWTEFVCWSGVGILDEPKENLQKFYWQ